MENYTILLVDDEEEVIQAIMKNIHWESLGFSVIGYACNGVKALEMVEEGQPDVVMTDIKMPYMDGMELAHRIKAEYPATKLLLFTGFDEFEYAKEAVHLEVEEYILKPVNAAELKHVFTQLKVKLDQEISEKRNVEILQKYYMESLPLLQADFYVALIEGRIQEEEIPKYLSDYQLSFPGPFFSCLVIHTSSCQMPADMNPLLLSTSVKKQAKEHLAEKWQAKCFSYLDHTILIAQLKQESLISELTDECDRFCKYARRMIGAVVTIGVGQVCSKILELEQSYGSAREAISYRSIYGSSRAINRIEVVPQKVGKSDLANEEDLANLLKIIRLGTQEEVGQAAHKYLDHTFYPEKTLQQYHIDIMELLCALYRFSVNHDLTSDDFSGDMRSLYNRLLDLEPEAFEEWLVGICFSFREMIIHVRNSSTKSFVSRAKEYVHQNYGNEALSLDCICEALGVSNSYFSTIFKKEIGSSFISYLTDYRMDRAASLLIETNEKSYMIAKKVGYSDPNYFSYVFKRRFGVSPSKYRTEHAFAVPGDPS